MIIWMRAVIASCTSSRFPKGPESVPRHLLLYYCAKLWPKRTYIHDTIHTSIRGSKEVCKLNNVSSPTAILWPHHHTQGPIGLKGVIRLSSISDANCCAGKKKSFENYFLLAKWDVHKLEKESSCKMFSLKAVHSFEKILLRLKILWKVCTAVRKYFNCARWKKMIWMLFEKYFEKCSQLWENTPLQEMSDTSVHCRHPEIIHSYILWIINLITFFFKYS